MKTHAYLLLLPLLLTGCDGADTKTAEKPEVAAKPEPAPPPPAAVDACAVPTKPAATPEETAWQLFVAINCASGDTAKPLAWQTWTEQTCIVNPGDPDCAAGASKRFLHGSRLRAQLAKDVTVPLADDCQPMVTAANAPAALKPFVPTNLAADAKFCEEVFLNKAEMAYVDAPAAGHSLRTLTSQNAYVAAGNTINFPTDAVEVKANWLPAASLAQPFTCDAPPAGVYTETIDGTCYALVGMHISSKLYPNWLWATFEPQNATTNPNRCKPDLYGACNDAWGSNPAVSEGAETQVTPALDALMTAAKLPAALRNYRLTGAQIDYVDNTVTQLGSSFVELNAQVLPGQASCITCHAAAKYDNATTPPTGGNGGPAGNPVGVPTPQPPNWISQDFSWFLGILPAAPPASASAAQ